MFDKSDRERWAKDCYDNSIDMNLLDKGSVEICAMDKNGRWYNIAIEDVQLGMDVVIRGDSEKMLEKGLVFEGDIIQIPDVKEIAFESEDFMICNDEVFCSNNDISEEYADYQYQLAINGNEIYDKGCANFNETFDDRCEDEFEYEPSY